MKKFLLILFSLLFLASCGGSGGGSSSSGNTSNSDISDGNNDINDDNDDINDDNDDINGGNDDTSGDNDDTSGDNDDTSGGNDDTSGDNDDTSGDNDDTSGGNDDTSGGNDDTSGDNDDTSGGNDDTSGSDNDTDIENKNYTLSKNKVVVNSSDTVNIKWDIKGNYFTVVHFINDVEQNVYQQNTSSIDISNLSENEHHNFVIKSDTGEEILLKAYTGTEQPTRMVAKAFDQEAELTWEAVLGATGYNIYITTEKGKNYKLLADNVATTSLRVKNLINDKLYYFAVEAVLPDLDNKYFSSYEDLKPVSGLSTFSSFNSFEFGEDTSVIPGISYYTPFIFSVKRHNNAVYLTWTAVPNAVRYNLYGADEEYGYYTLISSSTHNSKNLNLPVSKNYYYIKAEFDGGVESSPTPYIRMDFNLYPESKIFGGYGKVNVAVSNYDKFKNIDLACKPASKIKWSVANVTKSNNYNAGPLAPGLYDCKLILTYLNNVRLDSDIQRINIKASNPSDLGINSISSKLDGTSVVLRWNKNGSKYDVLMDSSSHEVPMAIAEGLTTQEYKINNLKCGRSYEFYIKYSDGSMSDSVQVKVDDYYCKRYGKKKVATVEKLFPEGDIPSPRAMAAGAAIGDNIYVFGGNYKDVRDNYYSKCDNPNNYNDLYVYNVKTNKWRKLNPENPIESATNSCAQLISSGSKLYLIGHIVGKNKNPEYYYVYNPDNGTDGSWERAGTLETDLYPIPVLYKDKIVVFSKQNQSIIDTVTNTVTPYFADNPIPFRSGRAVVLNDDIYIRNGTTDYIEGSLNERYILKIDFLTGKAVRIKTINDPSTYAGFNSITAINNKMYIFDTHSYPVEDDAEHSYNNWDANYFWEYDPILAEYDFYNLDGDYPPYTANFSTVAVDGKIYIFGGRKRIVYDNGTARLNFTNDLYVITP